MKNLIVFIFAVLFISQSYAQYGFMSTKCTMNDVATVYSAFKSGYVEACGTDKTRIKWTNSSQTVSEGIGYGMIFSVVNNDQTTFNGLLKYYKANLDAQGLMNWKIEGCGSASGLNAAPDADEDVAISLIFADKKWGSTGSINYNTEAKSVIAKLKQYTVEATSLVLKAGDVFGGSNLTNISYFAPAYYKVFGEYTSDGTFWNGVADRCYDIINKNLSVNNAVGGLVSDWCKADGNYSSDAGGYAQGGKTYSYDACRTPWRIAVDYHWYNDARAKAYLDKVNTFVNTTIGGIKNVKDGYNQNGTASGQWRNNTFVGTFTCAGIASSSAKVDEYYTELSTINPAWGGYFDYCFDLFAKILISGNFKKPSTSTSSVSVTGVTLSPTTLNLQKGSTSQLTATVAPSTASNKTISYSSSNVAIATVSASGLITALANGATTITATTADGGKKATCAISVFTPSIAVTGVTLNPTTLNLEKGTTSQLTATIAPSTASNKTISYSSSNAAIATVSTSGLVTALANGATTITATTADGGKKAICFTTVTTPTCTLSGYYGVPRSNALPEIPNTQFKYLTVLGTGGPNLSTVEYGTIEWAPSYNGLNNFSLQLKVSPYWLDLKAGATVNFNTASPSISLAGTGISGLDGNYWVTLDASNFVMISKTGNYVLYWSKSATPPTACATITSLKNELSDKDLIIYPNPAKDVVTLSFSSSDKSSICFRDLGGRIVLQQTTSDENQVFIPLSRFTAGVYFVSVQNAKGTIIRKLIVE